MSWDILMTKDLFVNSVKITFVTRTHERPLTDTAEELQLSFLPLFPSTTIVSKMTKCPKGGGGNPPLNKDLLWLLMHGRMCNLALRPGQTSIPSSFPTACGSIILTLQFHSLFRHFVTIIIWLHSSAWDQLYTKHIDLFHLKIFSWSHRHQRINWQILFNAPYLKKLFYFIWLFTFCPSTICPMTKLYTKIQIYKKNIYMVV